MLEPRTEVHLSLIVRVASNTEGDKWLEGWRQGPWDAGGSVLQAGSQAFIDRRARWLFPKTGDVLIRPDFRLHRGGWDDVRWPVLGLECVRTPGIGDRQEWFLVVHTSVRADGAVMDVRLLSHSKAHAAQGSGAPLSGTGDVQLAQAWWDRIWTNTGLKAASDRYPYSVSFINLRAVEADTRGGDDLRPLKGYDAWEDRERWLWALAARADVEQFPPPQAWAPSKQNWVPLSDGWHAHILRDGASFVFDDRHLPLPNGRSFGPQARKWTQEWCLDALLLGVLQAYALTAFAERTASLFNTPSPTDRPLVGVKRWTQKRDVEREAASLRRSYSRFRSRYWWQFTGDDWRPNELLACYQRRLRLPQLEEQISAELNDYAEQLQADTARRLNDTVTTLTFVIAPGSLGIYIVELFGLSGWSALALAVAIGVVLLFALYALRAVWPKREHDPPK